MWRGLRIGISIGLVPLALVVWAASQAQFSFRHPRARDVRVLVTTGGARLALDTQGPTGPNVTPADAHRARPRLIADQLRHDFGYMDPLTRGSHRFVVKNEGDARLLLDVVSTTCQCTVAGVINNQIEPGSEGEVELKWTVPGHGRVFRQIATVRTNDPRQATISFAIEGLIRTSLGADREEVSVHLDPDQSASTELIVFSQQWDDFSIAKLDTDIDGLAWEQAPVDEAALEALKGKSGRTLLLTLPGHLTSSVTDRLRLTIEPRGADGEPLESVDGQGRQLEIPLHVSVRRRLSIYGPAIRSGGLIEAGETQQGVGKQLKMQLKVRDREVSLPDLQLETTPSFLQADVVPHINERTSEVVPGLYDFVVTIPPTAPACSYLGDALGQVRIKTSHPRIPETPLGVRFAVLPR